MAVLKIDVAIKLYDKYEVLNAQLASWRILAQTSLPQVRDAAGAVIAL